jgi:septum formation inhibitor MinC
MTLEKLLEALAGTAELMGAQLSPIALAMMAKDLQEYEPALLMQALSNVRKASKFFNLNAIIVEVEKLKPDGRLGADEAWAVYPQNEADSAVLTDEISEAMHIALPLLNMGDKIGARMAFKEAYVRIVTANKAANIQPKWFPSLGSDKDSRDQVIAEAVRQGRLTSDHAQSLLPAPVNQQIVGQVLQLQNLMKDSDLTPERMQENRQRMASIKSMLTGK